MFPLAMVAGKGRFKIKRHTCGYIPAYHVIDTHHPSPILSVRGNFHDPIAAARFVQSGRAG